MCTLNIPLWLQYLGIVVIYLLCSKAIGLFVKFFIGRSLCMCILASNCVMPTIEAEANGMKVLLVDCLEGFQTSLKESMDLKRYMYLIYTNTYQALAF